MPLQETHKTVYRERALLADVILPDEDRERQKELLDELEKLSETAGADVQGRITQNRSRPDSTYYVGSGKVREIQERVQETDASVVIFNNDLSPAQGRNLEEDLDVKVLDRSELILDIFARHARTKEAKLQVELAQLKYTLPRLKRMWTHLSRQAGGIGTRGPGERQIEMDRRLANRRINELQEKIDEVQAQKKRRVQKRSDEFTISLVGYTNAGKTTLMNRLTGTERETEDQLFSTLSTKTRKWSINSADEVLLSDTVGFIRDIPHHLIASFHATLEETREADLLFHVVDASHPNAKDHIESVHETLRDLEVQEVPELLILNKQDKIDDDVDYRVLRSQQSDALEVSARTGKGLEELKERVSEIIDQKRVRMELSVPVVEGKLLSMIQGNGKILRQDTVGETMEIETLLGPRYAAQVPEEYVLSSENGKYVTSNEDTEEPSHDRY